MIVFQIIKPLVMWFSAEHVRAPNARGLCWVATVGLSFFKEKKLIMLTYKNTDTNIVVHLRENVLAMVLSPFVFFHKL